MALDSNNEFTLRCPSKSTTHDITMKQWVSTTRPQRPETREAPTSSIIGADLRKGDDEARAIDKVLEEEFSSILKQCNIFEGHTTETLTESRTKSPDPEDDSCHSSIIDSTHISSNFVALDDDSQTTKKGIPNPIPTLRSIASGKYYSSSIFPRWIGRRRNKSLFFTRMIEDIKNPLLNPNAIHDRESMDMIYIKEEEFDVRDDEEENTNQLLEGDKSRPDAIGDVESSSVVSSLRNASFAAPVLRAIGSTFVRDRRKGKFQKLHIDTGSKNGISPTSGRPPRSPSSSKNSLS